MNGVFDLGGTDGLGPVVVPEDEPIFRAEWEKAAFALFSMCFRAGFFGVDQFRHGIELIDPAVYLKSPYYEHWVHTVEHFGEKLGKLDLAELERRGHTRRARYIRGAVGEVVLAHGTFIYPDTAGNDLGECPEHVYTVRFTNEELWGAEAAEPNGSVYFDVWDPYIEHADREGVAA